MFYSSIYCITLTITWSDHLYFDYIQRSLALTYYMIYQFYIVWPMTNHELSYIDSPVHEMPFFQNWQGLYLIYLLKTDLLLVVNIIKHIICSMLGCKRLTRFCNSSMHIQHMLVLFFQTIYYLESGSWDSLLYTEPCFVLNVNIPSGVSSGY